MNMKYALLSIKKNIKNAKELKSSFIISIVGMCINNIAFLVLWYYFGAIVGNLNGWESIDIFGLYGINSTSFGIVCAFLYGIYNIPSYISSGNFDKYLVTPKSTLIKVATSSIQTSALGDFTFGLICFFIYIVIAKLSILQILTYILMILVSGIIFFSFSLICMSISFYLIDGENISQGLYSMFLSTSLYHGGAFTGILRAIFMFVIPSLLLGAVPIEIIKDITIIKILLIVLIAILWFLLSIKFFYTSLKKYESNNFFGFGG